MAYFHAKQGCYVQMPICYVDNSIDETPNKLFIGGIPLQTTEKELEVFFSNYGPVRDVRIVTDRITAECKGYGFVTFFNGDAVDYLVNADNVQMNGRKLRVRKAIRRTSSQFNRVPKHFQKEVPISTNQFVNHVIDMTPTTYLSREVKPIIHTPLTPPNSPIRSYTNFLEYPAEAIASLDSPFTVASLPNNIPTSVSMLQTTVPVPFTSQPMIYYHPMSSYIEISNW